MNYDKYLGLMGTLNTLGHMSPHTQPMAEAQRAGISNMAQAHHAKEAAKAEKKAQRGGMLGKLGSTLGMIGGSMVPGIGPVLGPALGSALGGTAGQAIGGAGVNIGDTLGYAGQGAIGGAMGQMMGGGFGGAKAAPAPAGGSPASQATMRAGVQAVSPGHTPSPPPVPAAQTTGGAWDAARQTMTGGMMGNFTGLNQALQPTPGHVNMDGVQWVRDEYGRLQPMSPVAPQQGYFGVR